VVARQAEHFGDPWFTRYIGAPVGAQLGLHALMPLPSALLIPVTVTLGPSVSYNLLSALMPGLLCYATYRVARLWLRSQVGAIAAGAFFGLSSMLSWRSFYHLNLAAGVLFFPLALEAAVRFRRRPGWRQALVLGLVVGGGLLTDQEMGVLGLSWPSWLSALAAAPPDTARVCRRRWPRWSPGHSPASRSSPSSIRRKSGGASSPLGPWASPTSSGGVGFANHVHAVAVAERLGAEDSPLVYHGSVGDGIPTFGLVLSVVALLGLVLAWRRRSAWLLALPVARLCGAGTGAGN